MNIDLLHVSLSNMTASFPLYFQSCKTLPMNTYEKVIGSMSWFIEIHFMSWTIEIHFMN